MRIKKQLLSFLFVAFLLAQGLNSFASHIFGGELLYKNISGNTYKITLTLYGDCSAAIFYTLDSSQPRIYVYNNLSSVDSLILLADTLDIDVSPVCPSQLNNTTCSQPKGTLPGVKKFIYSAIITLPGTSSNWRFIFAGTMGISSAGRSTNITNINGGTTIQLEATLNNVAGPNNSPQYSTIPTPFYCVGIDQQYNQGAIDQDGDSLSFSLVPGINAGGSPLTAPSVVYNLPYTPTDPLATAAGSFVFNALNGQMSFTPSLAQDALIVNEVSEYRHGVLVGTSKREMTFIITDNCGGTPPSLHVANIAGGALVPTNIIKICAGTPQLTFDINISNPDGDSTDITTSDLPPAAILSINNNNGPHPLVNFSWVTDTLTTGIYTFYVYVKNNHCPIANRQTLAYTINVVPLPTMSASLIDPTGCVHQAFMGYNLANGYLPRTLAITDGTGTVKTYTDSTGVIRDSLPPGNYVAYASSNPLCKISYDFSITDSGKLPLLPYIRSFCMGDTTSAVQIPIPGAGTIVTWFDANNNILPTAPTPNTAAANTSTWYVTEQYKVCSSDKVPVTAVVHTLPDIDILNRPNTICYGDTIYLEASGGVAYTWTPENRIETSVDGRLFTRLVNGGIFSVKVTNEFNCLDSASVTYTNIQPCCNFYYPNAFTPNGDHHNDGFKVITNGNMRDYKLAVFNRWGQMVFLTYDPQAYWDGKLYGTPCEPGTYYYYFKARCLTGVTEEKKGDVTLIR